MRAFVAVEVHDATEAPAQERAPRHLTLRFLGEVPDAGVRRLTELLPPVGASVAPFELVLEGVGAFPTASRPRVVWLAVTQGRAEIERLATEVSRVLTPDFGAAPERFVPHLTLFRVRSPHEQQAARELLDGLRPSPPPLRCWVREFALKESQLGPRGATHRTLLTVPLRGSEVR